MQQKCYINDSIMIHSNNKMKQMHIVYWTSFTHKLVANRLLQIKRATQDSM